MKRVALGVAVVVTVVAGGTSACSGAEWGAPVGPPDGFAVTRGPRWQESCGPWVLTPDRSVDDPFAALMAWVGEVSEVGHSSRPVSPDGDPDGMIDGRVSGTRPPDGGDVGFVIVEFDGSRITVGFCPM